jgi:subtilisin family serine protease
MSSRHIVAGVFCGALFLAACADDPTAPPPDSPGATPQLSVATDLEATQVRHLVVFNSSRGIPADFETAVSAIGGTLVADFEQLGGALVAGLEDAGARSLRARNDVRFVEIEPVLRVDPMFQDAVRTPSADRIASPSDPTQAWYFIDQWNMRVVEADAAWGADRLGSADVTVAILDSGIDYTHIDLQGRVDMNRSISFVPSDDALIDAYFPGYEYFGDINFHGTLVGSLVASNAYAAAGITSKVTLMSVKVCGFGAGCPSVISGLLYAIDAGADVINMSLGGWFTKRDNPGATAFYSRILNYANRMGVTVVVAAGNDEMDLDHNGNLFKTWCDAPHVICVSATGPTFWSWPPNYWENLDAPAPDTNYGRSGINVAAPGGTAGDGGDGVAGACTSHSMYTVLYGFLGWCVFGDEVMWGDGTSFSAPHVAGAAALLVEEFGRKPARIKTRIQQSADDLGEPGVDPFYGKGRLNVARALQLD